MGLWNGTALNTNILASSVPKWWDEKGFPMVVKGNGLLYFMMGKSGMSENPNGSGIIKVPKEISGNKLNVKLFGTLDTWNVLAEADQDDVVSLTNDTDYAGAAQFDWVQLSLRTPVVHSELRQIRGDEARTASWIEDRMMLATRGLENAIGGSSGTSGINGNAAPSTSALGGWIYGVDDSATYDAYGTITRSDAGNVDFRSGVATAGGGTGSLELNDIDLATLDISKNGGKADVAVVGTVGFNKLRGGELRNYVQYNSDVTRKFPTQTLEYGNLTILFDHRCGNSDMGIFSSEALRFYVDGEMSPWMLDARAFTKGTDFVIGGNIFMQFVIGCPSWCYKIKGITS